MHSRRTTDLQQGWFNGALQVAQEPDTRRMLDG